MTNNILLGELTVDGIPKGPPGQAADVRFTYDLNGVLEVEVSIVADPAQGHARDYATRPRAGGRSDRQGGRRDAGPEDVSARRGRPSGLAETGGTGLPGIVALRPQQALGQLLDGFEDALELGEKEAVERYRQALEEFLNEHDMTWGDNDETTP